MASLDPTTVATQLATAYTQNQRSFLTSQATKAQATATGLTTLQSALSAFDSALTGLSGKKSVVARTASFDTTGFATATASGTAVTGTYSLSVSQVAVAAQKSYSITGGPDALNGGSQTLDISVPGATSPLQVVLNGAADTDKDGALSVSEIARAINNAAGNSGLVSASVVTVDGVTARLILTAGKTGAGDITVATSGSVLSNFNNALTAGPATTVTGADAIVNLGGVLLQQASNTFTNIGGVSFTVSKVTTSPLTLTVSSDSSGTNSNVQSFVDAYNTLVAALDKLTATAGTEKGATAGVFASDAGIRALRDRLSSLVRQQSGTGMTLASYGVSIDRYGKMSLDTAKLAKTLTSNPTGLDSLLGSASLSGASGLLGSLDSYVRTWTNVSNGQITRRQTSVQSVQKSINNRQAQLDGKYNAAYQRYLKQFTALQALQSRMSDTSNMFSSLPTSG